MKTIKYYIKYSDEEGETCYSDSFGTPYEAEEHLLKYIWSGYVIKRTITMIEEYVDFSELKRERNRRKILFRNFKCIYRRV